MIPSGDFLYEEDIQKEEQDADLIWKIEGDRMRGTRNKLEAVVQSVKKRLDTEADVYEIYSENYGLKTLDLVGKDADYAALTLKRRIEESLKFDKRVLNITFIESTVQERVIALSFEIICIYGSFEIERSFKI